MVYEKDALSCPLGELEGGTCKVTHYAVVEKVLDQTLLVSECNMYRLYPSGCGYRFIPADYEHLLGFFGPV